MWNFKLFQFSEFSNEFFNISLPCLSKATLRKIMCQWPPFLRLRACIPVTWPRRLLRRQLKKSQIMTPSVKLSVRQSGRNQSIFLSYLFIYLEVMRLKFHVKSVLIRSFMWHFSAKVLRWFESKLEGDCQLFLTLKSGKNQSHFLKRTYLFDNHAPMCRLHWFFSYFEVRKSRQSFSSFNSSQLRTLADNCHMRLKC